MCTQCFFLNKHTFHKILLLEDEESLNKQNINLDLTVKDFDGNYEKIIKKRLNKKLLKLIILMMKPLVIWVNLLKKNMRIYIEKKII